MRRYLRIEEGYENQTNCIVKERDWATWGTTTDLITIELTGNVSTQSYIEKTTPTTHQFNKAVDVSVYTVFGDATQHSCTPAAVCSTSCDIPYKEPKFRCYYGPD